jgi:hypothetical protein
VFQSPARHMYQRCGQFSFMTDRLKQKGRFFNTKTFELTDSGLRGLQKGLFSSNEYFVDYDDIGIRTLKEKGGRNGWLGASTIALVLAIFLFARRLFGGDVGNGAEFFYLLVSGVCGLVFILTYKRKFYLVKSGNVNAIEFFDENPTKQEFDDFIERIKTRRNKALEDKYGQINPNLSYEQNHQNQIWLLNNDVINKEEFDKRNEDLNSTFSSTVRNKIGFNLGEN